MPLLLPTLFNEASRHLKRLKRLSEYEDTVAQRFPTLPRQWSISKVDALVLGYFLERWPHEVVVLDIGTFAGVSAFHFATHPKVLRVISVDPNPLVADEINDKSTLLGLSFDPEPFQNLRVLDVARAALAEFADEQQKIQLCVGIVGSHQIGIHGGPLDDLEKVESTDTRTLERRIPCSLRGWSAHQRRGSGRLRGDLKEILTLLRFCMTAEATGDPSCRRGWKAF